MGDESDQRLRESLSALMDGEANELELHRVLDKLNESSELRAIALSYERIDAAIRHEPGEFANIDLSASIRAAIADEFDTNVESESGVDVVRLDEPQTHKPQINEPQTSSSQTNERFAGQQGSGWVANLIRFGIAASVAVATVVGVQSWQLANRGDAGVSDTIATFETPDASPGNSTITSEISASRNFGVRGIQAGLGSEPSGMTPEQLSHAHGYAAQVAQARFRAYMLEHAEQASAYGGSVVPFVRAASFETVPR